MSEQDWVTFGVCFVLGFAAWLIYELNKVIAQREELKLTVQVKELTIMVMCKRLRELGEELP